MTQFLLKTEEMDTGGEQKGTHGSSTCEQSSEEPVVEQH